MFTFFFFVVLSLTCDKNKSKNLCLFTFHVCLLLLLLLFFYLRFIIFSRLPIRRESYLTAEGLAKCGNAVVAMVLLPACIHSALCVCCLQGSDVLQLILGCIGRRTLVAPCRSFEREISFQIQ